MHKATMCYIQVLALLFYLNPSLQSHTIPPRPPNSLTQLAFANNANFKDPFDGFGDDGFGDDDPFDDSWPKDKAGFEQNPPEWPVSRTFPPKVPKSWPGFLNYPPDGWPSDTDFLPKWWFKPPNWPDSQYPWSPTYDNLYHPPQLPEGKDWKPDYFYPPPDWPKNQRWDPLWYIRPVGWPKDQPYNPSYPHNDSYRHFKNKKLPKKPTPLKHLKKSKPPKKAAPLKPLKKSKPPKKPTPPKPPKRSKPLKIGKNPKEKVPLRQPSKPVLKTAKPPKKGQSPVDKTKIPLEKKKRRRHKPEKVGEPPKEKLLKPPKKVEKPPKKPGKHGIFTTPKKPKINTPKKSKSHLVKPPKLGIKNLEPKKKHPNYSRFEAPKNHHLIKGNKPGKTGIGVKKNREPIDKKNAMRGAKKEGNGVNGLYKKMKKYGILPEFKKALDLEFDEKPDKVGVKPSSV